MQEDNKNIFNAVGPVKIELGCGENKREGYLGIDFLPLKGVDFVANIEEGLPFIETSSVDEMVSYHVLEHIQNFELLMSDIYRVLKPNGKKKIVVPHFSNPYYYSDYTHKRFFGLYSFDYFSKNQTKIKRKVPSFYNSTVHFEVLERKLVFNNPPFVVRNLIRRGFTRLFNLNTYMQEFYEGWFTWIIPCTEIHFTIKPIKEV